MQIFDCKLSIMNDHGIAIVC